MLAVHRHDLRTAAVSRSRHQLSGADQGLLVGQSNALALLNGGQSGTKAHHPHHGGHYRVRLRQRGRLQKALHAVGHPDGQPPEAARQLHGGGHIPQHYQPGQKCPGLLLQETHAPVSGQSGHPEPKLPGYLQSLPANGAGRPQE